MVDPHTIATFAFAGLRRDPGFAAKFPWVRNTVVCVESDLAADVLLGMAAHHFPGNTATLACYYPDLKRFMFIGVDRTQRAGGPRPASYDVSTAFGALTVGMLIDAVYAGDQDWDALLGQQHERAEVSTAAIEKTLALA